MGRLEDLEAVRGDIQNVKDSDIIKLSLPILWFLQQVQILLLRLFRNREKLESEKMDFRVLDYLMIMREACFELYSQTSMVSFPKDSHQRRWQALKEEGEMLLFDLMMAMEYAFHGYPELLSKLSFIREGSSNADFIKDLNDASVLGRENRDLIEAVGYDYQNFVHAGEMSKELGILLAEATIDKSQSPELTLQRNKALTILKNGVDGALRQARFILRSDKNACEHLVFKNPPKYNRKKKTDDDAPAE